MSWKLLRKMFRECEGRCLEFRLKATNLSFRDNDLDLDSFTLFYAANYNVTIAVTYFELDNVTSKLDTNFLYTSSKSVN